MLGFQRSFELYPMRSISNTWLKRKGIKGWFKAVILPLSALVGWYGTLFAWPDPETPRAPTGRRVQLYPNRETGLSAPEKDFQKNRAEIQAKSRRNARAHLDAFRVELAWLADPVLFAHPPGIKAVTTDDKPCIEIRGVVNSHSTRQRALDLAQKFSETPVRDKLLVLVGPSIPRQVVPPSELQAKAERFLTDRLIEFSQDLRIEEVYPSGSIRVGGRVLSYEDKVAVSRSLRRLTGCMGVDNRVEVSPMMQDGELVTIITSDGEHSLVGKIDEKRSQPVALITGDKTQSDGTVVHEDFRTDAAPRPVANSEPARQPKKKETVAVTSNSLPKDTDRQNSSLTPLHVPVESSIKETATRPLVSSKPGTVTPAKRIVPVPVTPAPLNENSSNPSGNVTTGVAVIEDEPSDSKSGNKVAPKSEAGVQAVAGWTPEFPAPAAGPDGTVQEVPASPGGFFPNRPRFFQPSAPLPAPQRLDPQQQQQRSSVKLLPSGNGTPVGTMSPNGTPVAVDPGQPNPTIVSPPRRRGFLNGLGQPTAPRLNTNYLSPVDVSQSGRVVAAPNQRPQPNTAAQLGPDGKPISIPYGSTNRTFNGQNYQPPGAVRLTPSNSLQGGAQPGAVGTLENGTQPVYPWDQPLPTDQTVQANPNQPGRNARPGRSPSLSGFSSNGNVQRPGSSGYPANGSNAFSTPSQQRPIATNNPRTVPTPSMVPAPLPNLPAASQDDDRAAAFGAGTVDKIAPAQGLPSGSNAFPSINTNGSSAVRLPAPLPGAGSPGRPAALPAGELPPPSTGSISIDEGPAIPAFVPGRTTSRPKVEENKNLEKNQALLGGRNSAQPVNTPPAGSPGLGSIEIDKESINRPLPSPESLTELARRTCGNMISDIKTRKEASALCVEITVKDALTEDEVLKRLCNLAAFTHPAIRIEVTRAP